MIISFRDLSPVPPAGPSQWPPPSDEHHYDLFLPPAVFPKLRDPEVGRQKRGQKDVQPRQKPDPTLSNT